MNRLLRYLLRLVAFWMLLFAFNRVVFLHEQAAVLHQISWSTILESFRYSLKLDLSAACYSTILPFLLVLGYYLTTRRSWLKALEVCVGVLIFLHGAIAYGEAALYTQWHSKLSWQALAHFRHPSEVFHSASWGLTWFFFLSLIVFDALWFAAYHRWLHPRQWTPEAPFRQRRAWALGLIVPIGFGLLTGIRGGWHRFPISQSNSYYSTYPVLNDAAVNASWALVNNLMEAATDLKDNPYHWMPQPEAQAIVDSLYHVPVDSSAEVLTEQRPNVVLFILESWSSDPIQAGGQPELTPVFDSLIRGGLYFDSCYATGFVSDQGIPGTLGAFPASADISICRVPERATQLPSINRSLASVGYHSGFYYGGQLDYGNLQSYIFNQGFQRILSSRDYPATVPRGSLGIPDGVMADTFFQAVNRAQEPFFYCWYTLSSHMPYDIPAPHWIHRGGKEVAFINSIHYADSSLGVFMKQASRQPWFQHTLFVFVADHSHDAQFVRPVQHKNRHRIPLLFYGPVLKEPWKGKTLHQVCSQLDIAATLLHQLRLPYHQFPFSKDALNPYGPHFAAINYWNGTGFVTDSGFLSTDDRFPAFRITNLSQAAERSRYRRLAHAIQQTAFQYFLHPGQRP